MLDEMGGDPARHRLRRTRRKYHNVFRIFDFGFWILDFQPQVVTTPLVEAITSAGMASIALGNPKSKI